MTIVRSRRLHLRAVLAVLLLAVPAPLALAQAPFSPPSGTLKTGSELRPAATRAQENPAASWASGDSANASPQTAPQRPNDRAALPPGPRHGPGPGGPGDTNQLPGPNGMEPPFAAPFVTTSGTLALPPALDRFASLEFPSVRLRLERNAARMGPAERMEQITFLQRMMELKEVDPERYGMEKSIQNLEAKSEDIAAVLRAKPDGETAAKQKEELGAVLGQLFDLREKRREAEARQIEAELKHVRAILEQRQKNRDTIIRKRLEELTNPQDDLDW